MNREMNENEIPGRPYQPIQNNIYIFPAYPIKEEEYRNLVCDCEADEKCEEGCTLRDMNVECDEKCPCGVLCENKNFTTPSSGFALSWKDYGAKGIGVYCEQEIPKRKFIIEFVGEVVTAMEKNRRRDLYRQNGTLDYFMNLRDNPKQIIDASMKGNLARFFNHSCEPNAYVETWYVNGVARIGIFSKVRIPAGKEITINYGIAPNTKEPPLCLCGSKKCKGFLWRQIEIPTIQEEDTQEFPIKRERSRNTSDESSSDDNKEDASASGDTDEKEQSKGSSVSAEESVQDESSATSPENSNESSGSGSKETSATNESDEKEEFDSSSGSAEEAALDESSVLSLENSNDEKEESNETTKLG